MQKYSFLFTITGQWWRQCDPQELWLDTWTKRYLRNGNILSLFPNHRSVHQRISYTYRIGRENNYFDFVVRTQANTIGAKFTSRGSISIGNTVILWRRQLYRESMLFGCSIRTILRRYSTMPARTCIRNAKAIWDLKNIVKIDRTSTAPGACCQRKFPFWQKYDEIKFNHFLFPFEGMGANGGVYDLNSKKDWVRRNIFENSYPIRIT